ncbi:RNA-binding protein [Candidatus Woesearchaeota archaeon]|nr:RNA-binding protein [Candidatus Woesearchaeota archaeon]
MKQLNKRELQKINSEIAASYGTAEFFSQKDRVELSGNLVLNGKLPAFFYREGKVLPTLRLLLVPGQIDRLGIKKVAVDAGAVKFIVSGADVMRPGITRFDKGIAMDEVVAVVDEKHGKPLALGRMLFSGDEAQKLTVGKIIKSIHYVGDDLWFISELSAM